MMIFHKKNYSVEITLKCKFLYNLNDENFTCNLVDTNLHSIFYKKNLIVYKICDKIYYRFYF